MIGSEKLSTVREELHTALTATGDDPIRRLEERMSFSIGRPATVSGESEVLSSLRRFLEATETKKRRTKRSGAKKERQNR